MDDLFTRNYYDGGTVIERVDGELIAKVYMDPKSCYDVDDFKKVKIKYRISNSKGVTRTGLKTAKASIPDGARGNPELQYFYFTLKADDIILNDDKIYVAYAKGVLKSDETMVDDEKCRPYLLRS